ncbi:hypothetical protein EQU24_11525 [Methylotuvimicrobium buryatense]|uniref:Uncharacterized protein n=1 Tax=Methylotuvimicrobium buryatense TaxID=95641 RepID=A0A4P9UN64_METBY|nr:hypothetical protein EQU24_11525 [Methylotuvimicrobium buryatense]
MVPIELQISALTYEGAEVFGKGCDSRNAVTEPTWTYSPRPLTDTPASKFDQQRKGINAFSKSILISKFLQLKPKDQHIP